MKNSIQQKHQAALGDEHNESKVCREVVAMGRAGDLITPHRGT